MKRNTYRWIIFGCFAVFVAIALLIGNGAPTAFDDAVRSWMLSWRSEWLTNVFEAVSPLVSTQVFAILLIVFAVLFAFVYKKRMEPIMLVVNLAFAYAGFKWLKNVFERPRPFSDRLIDAYGFGFPSGNALMAAAFYGFVTVLLVRLWKRRRPWLAWLAAIIGTVVIVLIGVSRVYLGVHYATDILAGYALGAAWMMVCVALVAKRPPQ